MPAKRYQHTSRTKKTMVNSNPAANRTEKRNSQPDDEDGRSLLENDTSIDERRLTFSEHDGPLPSLDVGELVVEARACAGEGQKRVECVFSASRDGIRTVRILT